MLYRTQAATPVMVTKPEYLETDEKRAVVIVYYEDMYRPTQH